MSIIAELKRRNVFRMAGLYLVGTWLIVGVSSTVLPAFNVAHRMNRAIIAVLALALAYFGFDKFMLTPRREVARVYAWGGEKDQAFAWLERCFPIHDSRLVRLPFRPTMDALRKDPRFAALVSKPGIPK